MAGPDDPIDPPVPVPPGGYDGSTPLEVDSAAHVRSGARPRRGLTRLQQIVRAAAESPRAARRRVRIPLLVARVTLQVIRQWIRDRCPQQAASLAFQTLLSIVPMLALALAILRATGRLDAESSVVDFMARELLPVSREEIAARVVELSQNITFRTLGIVGLVTTSAIAFVMFNSLERIFNDIWRSERRRSLVQKAVVFYAGVTIAPVLLGLTLYEAARTGVTDFAPSRIALSLGASFGAGLLANYLLPTARVRIRPAVVGALVSAVCFEVAKFGFRAYVAEVAFAKYSGVYGTLALVPLLLIWVYWSWLVVLLGAEIAHTLQNLHMLEGVERRNRMPLETELLSRVNGVVAARIMVATAAGFTRGDKGLSRHALATRFDLSEEVIDRIVRRLVEADLAIELDDPPRLLPARPPSEITLAQIMTAFRGDDVGSIGDDGSALDTVLRALDDATGARTAVTLDRLV